MPKMTEKIEDIAWNTTGVSAGQGETRRTVPVLEMRDSDGERLGRLMRGVEEEGWRFVAFVRLVPLFPFNLMNYAFGLTRTRLCDYIFASFVCMVPGALAYTYLGYAGREAPSGQARAIHKAVLALALFAAVAFLPRLVRRVKGRALPTQRPLNVGWRAAKKWP